MISIQVHASVAAALSARGSLQGISLEEYLSRLANGGVAVVVPPLSAEFSRADIYMDQD